MERAPNQNGRGPWHLGTIVASVLVGLVSSIVLALVGLVVGATYGGNYAIEFEFNGERGYEATGQIGAIIGFAAGGPLCALLFYIIKCRR